MTKQPKKSSNYSNINLEDVTDLEEKKKIAKYKLQELQRQQIVYYQQQIINKAKLDDFKLNIHELDVNDNENNNNNIPFDHTVLGDDTNNNDQGTRGKSRKAETSKNGENAKQYENKSTNKRKLSFKKGKQKELDQINDDNLNLATLNRNYVNGIGQDVVGAQVLAEQALPGIQQNIDIQRINEQVHKLKEFQRANNLDKHQEEDDVQFNFVDDHMYGDNDKDDDEEKTYEQEQETDKGEVAESKKMDKFKKKSSKIEIAENGLVGQSSKKRKRCNQCREYKDSSQFGTKQKKGTNEIIPNGKCQNCVGKQNEEIKSSKKKKPQQRVSEAYKTATTTVSNQATHPQIEMVQAQQEAFNQQENQRNKAYQIVNQEQQNQSLHHQQIQQLQHQQQQQQASIQPDLNNNLLFPTSNIFQPHQQPTVQLQPQIVIKENSMAPQIEALINTVHQFSQQMQLLQSEISNLSKTQQESSANQTTLFQDQQHNLQQIINQIINQINEVQSNQQSQIQDIQQQYKQLKIQSDQAICVHVQVLQELQQINSKITQQQQKQQYATTLQQGYGLSQLQSHF